MARPMSTMLQVIRHVLHTDKAWIFLIEIPRKAGGFYRLARSSRHVTFGGKVWQAAAIEITLPDEAGDGSLGEGSISIPNVSRLPLATVEVDNELLGQDVTLYLVNEAETASLPEGLKFTLKGKAVTANEQVLTLECGHPAQLQRVPSRMFDRTRFKQLRPTGGGTGNAGYGGGG